MSNGNNHIMPQKNITISFGNDGLLYYTIDNKSIPLHVVQGNIFKINERFNAIDNKTDYQIQEIQTTDGIRTFRYFIPSKNTYVSRGGGSRGISGINVQDEGIQFGGQFITLNFAGENVTVTDDGGGQATVTITGGGGGGTITGGGTLNRLAMFTGASSIGDSPFLRSGSDVIADGFIYFNSGNGIDVVASGGADILNIGTTNADVINYGYAGTTHNMNGTVFNVFTTNLNVTDKIITLNDGGAAGSGGSSGFEIEEAGVATGYFIQNAGRTGFDFKASSNASVVTLSFIGVAANQTMTVQNASGTIAYLSDIPSSAGFFAQGGNSFGAPAILGTNDAFSLSFETSGVTRETISATGLFGINTAPVAGTLVTVQSTGTTSATWIEQWYNATPTLMFGVRGDGYITAGLANGSMTIGLGAGFVDTLTDNTFVGVRIAPSITTGFQNTGFGTEALFSLTTGNFNTAVGRQAAFSITNKEYVTAIGFQALTTNNSNQSTAVGGIALQFSTTGVNDAFGYNSLNALTTGTNNAAFGQNSLGLNTTGINNAAFGTNAGFSCKGAGSSNVYMGFQAGFNNFVGADGGSRNVMIGESAGQENTGSGNVFIGYRCAQSSAFDALSDILEIHNDTVNNPLIYGNFPNRNLALNAKTTTAWGTAAVGVFSITNGTEPTTSPADMIQIFSTDVNVGVAPLASLGLRTEEAVSVIDVTVPTFRLKVKINGEERYLLLGTVV